MLGEMLAQARDLLAGDRERARLADARLSLGPRITHVYVDGESHFIRSEQCVKAALGSEATLANYVERMHQNWENDRRGTGVTVVCALAVMPECKFFWDGDADPSLLDAAKVYFTSYSGDDDGLHSCRVRLRNAGFEPQIVKELGSLAQHRKSALADQRIIEKPKGVDIALAGACLKMPRRTCSRPALFFTTDADFLPVIEAVQRMGKSAYVYGYKSGLGKNSHLEYLPSGFFDLGPGLEQAAGICPDRQRPQGLRRSHSRGGRTRSLNAGRGNRPRHRFAPYRLPRSSPACVELKLLGAHAAELLG